MSIDYISIGARIKNLRLERGLTQNRLAEISGVEPSNISHIERAATKLSLPTLINIANALEVSLDEIVYNSLIKKQHITAKIIDELISDCSDKEINAIIEFIKVTKNILRETEK